MRTGIFVVGFSALVALVPAGISVAAQTPLNVFNVKDYGATGTDDCVHDPIGIQAAIEAAHDASVQHGGVVYFPQGTYCVAQEIKAYENITLKGASAGRVDQASATVLKAPSYFGTPPEDGTTPEGFSYAAMIRMANRQGINYGFQIEDLSLYTASFSPNIVGIDFTGVWFGAIRNVAVSGELGAGPRDVHSSGSIGFLFSDWDANSGGAAFNNIVEGTGVGAMDTAYVFRTHNKEAINTMTTFWITECRNGIWFDNLPGSGGFPGNVGLSFRDGYMTTTLGVPGKKAYKYTGGGARVIQIMNVSYETSNPGSPLGFGFDAGSDLRTNGYTSLSSFGGIPVTLEGDVSAQSFQPMLLSADGYFCGSTAGCPCGPGTYPPAQSRSFWAKIPAGTPLHGGENGVLTYYTTIGADNVFDHATPPAPLQNLFFSFHPRETANIGHMFQLTATNEVSCPYHYWIQTYRVKLFLPDDITPFSLSSDFVFFLEANSTVESVPAGSCLYPPSVPSPPTPAACGT